MKQQASILALFLGATSAVRISSNEKNVPEDNLVQLKGDDNNEKIIVRGEKEWQTWAQDLNDWSDNQTLMANTRIPYNSFIQLEGEPNNEPIIVRGEKEWQAWAQDLNDWSDGQTDAANSRIPYNSAVQLENEPIIVRGEKEWQAWAQDQNDQLDRQTDAANSRIPYQSTLINTAVLDPVGEQAFINIASDLVQLGNEPIIVRGEKEWQAWAQDQNDQLDRQTDAANSRIPYQSTLLNTAVLDPVGEQSWMEQASELVQIGNEPIIVRGEKEWQTWAQDQNDQLDKATDTANARIPYNSAIQTSDEKEDDLLVENNNLVPLNFRF